MSTAYEDSTTGRINSKPCSVENCNRAYKSRGYCAAHYQWARYRDFNKEPTHRINVRTPQPANIDTSDWSRENLAWCAAFIDADGSISTHKDGPNANIKASQKSPELLYRLSTYLGCGAVKQHGTRNSWFWQVAKRREVYAVLCALYQWFSQKRKQEARTAINNIKSSL